MTPEAKRFLSPAASMGLKVCIVLFVWSLPAEGELLGSVHPFRSSQEIGAVQGVAERTQSCLDAGECNPVAMHAKPLILAAGESVPASDAGGPLSKLRALAAGSDPQEEFLPMDKAFKVDMKAMDAHTLVANFSPAESYYLYRDKIGFTASGEPGISIAKVELPPGEKKSDPNFGDTVVFHKPFQAIIALERGTVRDGARVSVEARYQGCSEKGLCYPPAKKRFEFTLAGWSPAERGTSAASTKSPGAGTESTIAPVSPAALRDQSQPSTSTASSLDGAEAQQALLGGSLWLIVPLFFALGVGLAFTVCMLPMIPILSGIILGQSKTMTRARGLMLSGSYVLGMALTFTIAGVLVGLSGKNIAPMLQNPWVLGTFAGIFVLLALSMFGFYEIQMPTFIQSKATVASNRLSGGRVFSVFVMGALSAVIIGPCAAPPVFAALAFVSRTGDAMLGGTALFAMALGIGTPLLIVGASAGTLLPKAGPWMQTINRVFGVLMLGLATWIISPVIPSAVHMLLWSALLIVSAIYLHAIDPLPQNASGFRKLWKGIGVIALLLGVALLAGALSGGRDILQPLAGLRGGGGMTGEAAARPAFERVRSLAELQQRMALADGRAVMLDFYAEWCVSCKEMERFTFVDPQVRARMSRMLVLQADVTESSPEADELLKHFGLFGPPGIVFFSPTGVELERVRVIGFQSAERFVSALDAALQKS
jgi:thiol:disulfide interchange protein DsbD